MEGDVDPVGGGTVRLTVDHKNPVAWGEQGDVEPTADDFQALCARHQVVKKNFFDPHTVKFELTGILQAAPEDAKKDAYEFLKQYFGDSWFRARSLRRTGHAVSWELWDFAVRGGFAVSSASRYE